LDDAVIVTIDSQLGGACQHAVAFDAGDDFDAEGYIDRAELRAAVGGAADDGLASVAFGVDDSLYVFAARDGLDGCDDGRGGFGEQGSRGFDALALRGLHPDEALEGFGRDVEAVYEGADPGVGEFHGYAGETRLVATRPNCSRKRRSPLC